MSKLQSAVADFGTIFLDGKVRLPVAIGCLLLFFGVRPSVRVRRRPPPAKVRNLSSSRRTDSMTDGRADWGKQRRRRRRRWR